MTPRDALPRLTPRQGRLAGWLARRRGDVVVSAPRSIARRVRRQRWSKVAPYVLVAAGVLVAGMALNVVTDVREAYDALNAGVRATEDLVESLAAPAADEPSAIVLVARFGADRGGLPEEAFGTLVLDPTTHGSWLVGVPPEASLEASAAGDGLADVFDSGRPAIVSAANALFGTKANHYAEVDVAALARWIDARGGLTIAGDVGPREGEIPTPTPVVSAADVMAYLAVDNSGEMSLERYRRLHALLRSVAREVERGSGVFVRAGTIAEVAEWTSTDLRDDEAARVIDVLGQDGDGEHWTAMVPTLPAGRGRALDREALSAIMAAVGAGDALAPELSAGPRVEPASVSVTVHNGAGIEGCASSAAAILTAAGFAVGPVANANQFVYDTTLVVYRDDVLAADAVLQALPVGRRVASRGMYLFYTDILVVVGRDWPATP